MAVPNVGAVRVAVDWVIYSESSGLYLTVIFIVDPVILITAPVVSLNCRVLENVSPRVCSIFVIIMLYS